MKMLKDKLVQAKKIGIAGHIRPDGDCVGSCLALYRYLSQKYPEASVCVYLEVVPEVFRYLKDWETVITHYDEQELPADIFFCLDCSDSERLGAFAEHLQKAHYSVCIDHHISNIRYCDENYVFPEKIATCEALYDFFDTGLIDYEIAASLYTGIVHDSGAFRYENTSSRTMEIAGELMKFGIPFTRIIDESYFQKSYKQNLLLGECLLRSRRYLKDKVIISDTLQSDMKKYEAATSDLDQIVDQLRITKGVEVAVYLHELEEGGFKVSFRSNRYVDVSKIAFSHGGGGHIRAAGCTMLKTKDEIIEILLEELKQVIEE